MELTKDNIYNAYKDLFDKIGYDNGFCGYNDTIETFPICSDYGIELDGSTIDKIELMCDGRIAFYYNENINDYDFMDGFTFEGLKSFYERLVEVWDEDES